MITTKQNEWKMGAREYENCLDKVRHEESQWQKVKVLSKMKRKDVMDENAHKRMIISKYNYHTLCNL